MTLVAFLSHLRRLDVQLWVEEQRLRYSAPPGVVTPELHSEIAQRKAELIAFFQSTGAAAEQLSAPITPVARDEAAPLSVAQEAIWRRDQLQPGDPVLHVAQSVRLSGPLDPARLECSAGAIAQRHETLRSAFPAARGAARVVIAPRLDIPIPIQPVAAPSAGEPDAELRRIIQAEIMRPFDLARGPLVRLLLLRLAETEHILVITLHAIIADQWSITLFIHELALLYAAFTSGQPASLPELPLQYVDMAAWQRRQLQEPGARDHLAYWRRQLAGAPLHLALPHSSQAPCASHRARQELLIPKDVLTRIEALSYREGGTVFMTVLAALEILLHRATGQATLLIGTPTPGRTRKEADRLIGRFANMVALRADLSGELSFLELLKRVRAVCLDAYPHQDLPFEQLVAQLAPEPDGGSHPLFQAFLSLREAFAPIQAADVRLHEREIYDEAAPFDLALLMQTDPEGLRGCFDYCADRFDAVSMARMAGEFQALLERISLDPELSIAALARGDRPDES